VLISEAAIRNRTSVLVLIVLIVILGAMSYLTLPREAAPDVPIPIVLISTTYRGVAPADIESSVTMKIESKLTGLRGVKEIRSSSAEGRSLILIEFEPGVDIKSALADVRDKVDLAKPDLPDAPEFEEPFIREINVAEFPILMINIAGDISPVRMKRIADDLEDAIERVPGVLDVEVIGALEREIRIEVDPDRLAAYGLTLPELMAFVPSENVNVSAGSLETEGTRFHVRVPSEFASPEEVNRLIIATRGDRPIYLTDIARVRDTFKDRVSLSRLDGHPSVTLAVKKRAGANIVRIADAVKRLLEAAARRLPKGVTFEITLDFSDHIRMMVSDLENNIVSGFVLVMAVLMLFLGLRTSLIVALAIPMSMLMSFALLQALGYTLNMVVLFSLILALGMLVDNAIVIVENIFRHRQLGYGRIEAARKGTAEVAWPVATSTATTVAAFFPLLFWPGVMGSFMRYLPITLILTLSSSLFVALVISPTVCSLAAGGAQRTRPRHAFVRAYRRLLRLAVSHWAHRAVTLFLAGILLATLAVLYLKRGRGYELFPDVDPDFGKITIRAPQGTNLRETDRIARLCERRTRDERAHIEHLVTSVGSAGGDLFGGGTTGPHVGEVTLVFPDYAERRKPAAQVIADLRPRFGDLAGAEIQVKKEEHGPPTGAAVTLRIAGRDFQTLERLSEAVKRRIADVPGLVNLRSDLDLTRPEIVFRVDRHRAELLGVSPAVVGEFVKTAVFGREVGKFREFNDEYDITIRLPLEQRRRVDDLLDLKLPDATGRAIPLTSVGTFRYAGGFGTIHRINQKRVVTVTADAEGRLGPEVLKDVRRRLADLPLPEGYTITYAGQKEEEDKARRFLSKAFLLALLLIVMILVAQFNTLAAPVIIMTTVLLSLVGVLLGLLACRLPFGIIMTGVGVISLAGVVVNNAIVLLDYTRRLQRRGLDLIEATIEAGATRLRPVLLTAVTTILGLIPMAVGVSFDIHTLTWATRSQSSQWWRSMAVAVIFGLAFATLLTLFVVPACYVLLQRLALRLGLDSLRRPGNDRARAPGAAPPLLPGEAR